MARQPTPQNTSRKHIARLERERQQERYLKIGAGIVLALVAGLILYGILDQLVIKGMRPVARADNQTISVRDFQKEVRFDRYRNLLQLEQITSDAMMLQFFGSYANNIVSRLDSPTQVGQEVLDGMIEDIVVAREAKARGITLTEAEIDQEFEEAFGFFANGTPTPAPTETPFVYSTSTLSPTQIALLPPTATATLDTATAEATQPAEEATATEEPTPTAANEGEATPEATATVTPVPTEFTRDLFEEEVGRFVDAASDINFSRADLRDFLARQLLRTKVYEAITADVTATTEMVWARHILVASEEEAQQVVERLNNGESFVDLAAELSTDTSNKDQGGDLGWFVYTDMVPEFAEAAFALEVGEVSAPVQSSFGWHIIQQLGKEERPLDATQLDSAKSQAYQEWLEAAKLEVNAETYDRWIDVVPTEPEVPVELRSALLQLQQQQQQQTLP